MMRMEEARRVDGWLRQAHADAGKERPEVDFCEREAGGSFFQKSGGARERDARAAASHFSERFSGS